VKVSMPYCHIAFNFNCVFIKIVCRFKFCQETFYSQWSSKSHVLRSAITNINTVVPHCIQHELDFTQQLYNHHHHHHHRRHFNDALVIGGVFVSQGNGLIRHVETYPDFFFTARAHTTKSTVKILAANTHCKYFLIIAKVTHFFCTWNPCTRGLYNPY
jgi:hypothetical protein